MAHHIICAALYLFGSTYAKSRDYGMGFSLSHGYGVASVHYGDGSSWDIAHISGSVSYQVTMEAGASIPEHIEVIPAERPIPGIPDIACGNLYDDLYSRSSPAPLGMQVIYDQMPLWLGGSEPDKATQALTAMLFALKSATEAALETEIQQVYITAPFPVGDSFNKRLLAASTALGLRHRGYALSGPVAAAKAHGIFAECRQPVDESEKLVLVIDYSHSALIANLLIADCVFEHRRVLFSPEFGRKELLQPELYAGALETPEQRQAESHTRQREMYEQLVDALQRLTELPIRGVRTKQHTQIDRVVLVGELTEDAKLHGALEQVLGKRYGDLLRSAFESDRSTTVHPLYAAAEYAALCSMNGTEI